MRTIFVFAYYSYKDPVFQSAVLPYLKLVKSDQLKFILLTWEQPSFNLSDRETNEIRRQLADDNIVWFKTKWHSGRFKILKKAWDFIWGSLLSIFLIFKFNAVKIYTEGFPGAIIGHYLSLITRKKHIVHTFEPHADYMYESGVWSKKNWEYRILKKLEIPIANQCEHVITATTAYKQKLFSLGVKSKVWVIPSCIDFEKYQFREESRIRLRKKLGIRNDQIVLVYMGKIGGMYMEAEIFEFFRHCLDLDSDVFHFILLSNADEILVNTHCTLNRIPIEKVHLFFASKEEVPDYLSAADIGFCGIRPIESRKYSSPIKNGEYWACGLPVLIPRGISEDDELADNYKLGRSFEDFKKLNKEQIQKLTLFSGTILREKAVLLRDISQFKNEIKSIFNS